MLQYKNMRGLNKTQTIILLAIFIAIGGLILYKGDNNNNWNPLDYVFKR